MVRIVFRWRSLVLSVVIPTLNAATTLAEVLDGFLPGLGEGDLEVIVVDGGSSDATCALAQSGGANIISAPRGRGGQLSAGAKAARGDWLLFLHADTVLSADWRDEAAHFMANPDHTMRAGVFRLALDDGAPAARRLEALAAWRARVFGLPYGDQGLLIGRAFYQSIGGFRSLPLMEDVDLARRIGRARFVHLGAEARTSAWRYRRSGYVRRSARNLICLGLYFLGVKPRFLVRLYG
jgi:rSAM/selenodomain-associated transferase 2